MKVNVGSKWDSKDVRDKGRRVEVVEVRGSTAVVRNVATGRRVVISLARLLSKRWENVLDVSPASTLAPPPAVETKASGDA